MAPLTSRTRRIIAAGCGLALVVGAAGGFLGRHELNEAWLKYQWRDRHYNAAVMEKALMIAGGNPTEAQNESKEAVTIAEQFAQARTAPGIVAPGAYGSAFTQIQGLQPLGGHLEGGHRRPVQRRRPALPRLLLQLLAAAPGYVTGRVTGLRRRQRQPRVCRRRRRRCLALLPGWRRVDVDRRHAALAERW